MEVSLCHEKGWQNKRKERRELVRELLKETPVKDGQDLNNIMKEIIAEIVNGSLEGELEGELGYAKYDTKNKETDNSRNGYGDKRCTQAMVM